jgi:SAM-dependent methyltransferase
MVDLAKALVLSEPSSAHLRLSPSALKSFDLFALSSCVARASQDAVIVSEGLELLPQEQWRTLAVWCREALRPDGVLVLRLTHSDPTGHRSLQRALASCFSAVELFAWDGLQRAPARGGFGDAFAVCRPFLPYAVRSLELLRPRVVASGDEWQSSWLCEHPVLPERFLLRATLDVIAESAGEVDLRLKFVAPGHALFKVEGRLSDLTSGTAELLLSSQRTEARGDPRWSEVERIAIDVRTQAGRSVDVRISDVRVLCDDAPTSPSRDRTSAQLRGSYDDSYYRGMPGYSQYRENRTLRERPNVYRSYALSLTPLPARVTDIGSGRGELARHLLEQGAEVTLMDYSSAAMGFAKALVGERPEARFVVDDAANLPKYVAKRSQDAIFMTDFVEHLSVEELRTVLRSCHQVLAPDGVLVIHTPERYCGSIVTAKAIHGLHVTLFEIDTLEALLLEAFGAVDVFTWNGFERFRTRGHCIDLFAIAHPEDHYRTRSLSPSNADERGQADDARRPTWVFDDPRLPARFILDATVKILPSATEGDLEIALLAATGEHMARIVHGFHELTTLPAHLRLASELLAPEGPPGWDAVKRIVISASSRGGSPIKIAISDVCLRTV